MSGRRRFTYPAPDRHAAEQRTSQDEAQAAGLSGPLVRMLLPGDVVAGVERFATAAGISFDDAFGCLVAEGAPDYLRDVLRAALDESGSTTPSTGRDPAPHGAGSLSSGHPKTAAGPQFTPGRPVKGRPGGNA